MLENPTNGRDTFKIFLCMLQGLLDKPCGAILYVSRYNRISLLLWPYLCGTICCRGLLCVQHPPSKSKSVSFFDIY